MSSPPAGGILEMRRDSTRARAFSQSSQGSGTYARAIVMAVDSSENAKIAFDWYLDNIHRADDLIILTHCPEPPRLPTFKFKSGIAPPVDDWKKIVDEMNQKTRILEEDYEGTLIQRKLKYKVRGETSKNPGETILKIADDECADLICLGTRGQGGLKHAIHSVMGTVSEYVVRHSSLPVTVIPGRKLVQVKARRSLTVSTIQQLEGNNV